LSNESGAVSYPKSGENIGRGVELMHNSMLHLLLHKHLFMIICNLFRDIISFLIISLY
jgi:hypothetical protein